VEVDEYHEFENKKSWYQELQDEYCEDKEKRKNKNAKIDYHNDPLNEHGHNEDEKFGHNEDNEVG